MKKWFSRHDYYVRKIVFSSPTIFFIGGLLMKENLIIARDVRKTIKYIEANIYNFPNSYRDLKNNIINSCYEILRLVYTANIEQEIIYKKKAIVEIKMLNFFLSQALDKELITKKKFLSYGKHLENIHNMIYSWCNYEKSE